MAICALCRADKQLRDSHLLPASVYKLLRDQSESNPNPISIAGGSAVATSSQLSKPLLCDECEDRFSRLGERHVMSMCRRPGGFRLKDALVETEPIFRGEDGLRVYDLAAADGEHLSEYAYFAVSVVWRATVTEWNAGDTTVGGRTMGPYSEPVRRFLLGDAPSPDHLYVGMWLPEHENLDLSVIAPYRTRVRTGSSQHHRHTFSIPGIFFHVHVGKSVPRPTKANSINTEGVRAVFVGKMEGTELAQKIVETAKESTPRGSLKHRRPDG